MERPAWGWPRAFLASWGCPGETLSSLVGHLLPACLVSRCLPWFSWQGRASLGHSFLFTPTLFLPGKALRVNSLNQDTSPLAHALGRVRTVVLRFPYVLCCVLGEWNAEVSRAPLFVLLCPWLYSSIYPLPPWDVIFLRQEMAFLVFYS